MRVGGVEFTLEALGRCRELFGGFSLVGFGSNVFGLISGFLELDKEL